MAGAVWADCQSRRLSFQQNFIMVGKRLNFISWKHNFNCTYTNQETIGLQLSLKQIIRVCACLLAPLISKCVSIHLAYTCCKMYFWRTHWYIYLVNTHTRMNIYVDAYRICNKCSCYQDSGGSSPLILLYYSKIDVTSFVKNYKMVD